MRKAVRNIPIPSKPTLDTLRAAVVEVSKELNEQLAYNEDTVTVPFLNLDWGTGSVFYKAVTVASTFTFSNMVDGKTIILIVKNTSGGSLVITLPTTIKVPAIVLTVISGSTNIYTFIRANGNTYASYIDGMV